MKGLLGQLLAVIGLLLLALLWVLLDARPAIAF